MPDPSPVSALAEEALRRGKRLRRRRRLVQRGAAGIVVAGLSAGVALGLVSTQAQVSRASRPQPVAAPTTSSLPSHGARSTGATDGPRTGQGPAKPVKKHAKKPPPRVVRKTVPT